MTKNGSINVQILKKENVRDDGILIDSTIEVGFIIRKKKLNDIIIKKERRPNFSQEWTLLIDQGLMTNRTKFSHYQKKTTTTIQRDHF